MLLEAEFEATEELGRSEVRLSRQFDAVTCMFAIHYFFASERSLDNFFHNVSINLKEGKLGSPFACRTQGLAYIKRFLSALPHRRVFLWDRAGRPESG